MSSLIALVKSTTKMDDLENINFSLIEKLLHYIKVIIKG